MSYDLKITNGDISINKDGTLTTVNDNEKLRQDIIKIILTKVGENRYHPQYGSAVGALQIGSFADQEMIELDLASSAEEAVKFLMNLQKTQSKKQYLTPGEKIIAIKNIAIDRDQIDPRMYNIYISVYTEALTELSESLTIRIM